MPRPPRRTLDAEEQADAARLKRIYTRRKQETGLTQERLATQMGFSTQAAVSHYLNAINPMSNEIVFRFAHALDVDPADIRPGIWDSIPLRDSPLNGLSAEAVEFARELDRMSSADRELFLQTMRRFFLKK